MSSHWHWDGSIWCEVVVEFPVLGLRRRQNCQLLFDNRIVVGVACGMRTAIPSIRDAIRLLRFGLADWFP